MPKARIQSELSSAVAAIKLAKWQLRKTGKVDTHAVRRQILSAKTHLYNAQEELLGRKKNVDEGLTPYEEGEGI